MDNTIGISGRYQLKAVKDDGTSRHLGDFPNLITDAGLDRLAVSSSYNTYCQIGKGTQEPLPTDSGLTDFLLSSNTIVTPITYSIFSDDPAILSTYLTYRFPAGTISEEITEIGVGWAASGSLFSKSLLKDQLGNPTSIKLFPDENLDVTYIVDLYPHAEDVEFTLTDNTTTYNGIIRASNIRNPSKWATLTPVFSQSVSYAFDGPIRSIDSYPTGTEASTITSVTKSTYVPGSHYVEFVIRLSTDVGNFVNGIQSIFLDSSSANLGCYQIGFSPAIMKSDTDVLQLTLRISLARMI